MLIDTRHRSDAAEYMDDFSLAGTELNDALDRIASINKLLGGNRVTISGVRTLLKDISRERPVRILDIGCGNGDMLRSLAKFGNRTGRTFELTGIDANAAAIKHARQLSTGFPAITYICTDFLKSPGNLSYDIVLCTLTLHHFTDSQIKELISVFQQKATLGIVINDLHRHQLAYYLFSLICIVFRLSPLSRDDGLVSILRGFKRTDLQDYSTHLGGSTSIRWKWAFRFQWIIPTL